MGHELEVPVGPVKRKCVVPMRTVQNMPGLVTAESKGALADTGRNCKNALT